MNIAIRLADIERLLAEVVSTIDDQADDRPVSRASHHDGTRLIDDLDQAQMLKAASYGTAPRSTVG
jgi:hypothetical protein